MLEATQNLNFNHEVRQQINDHSVVYMQDNFKMLFTAIDNISSDKKRGQTMENELLTLRRLRETNVQEIVDLKNQISAAIDERDVFRQDAKDLYDDKIGILKRNNATC
jgi:hypothetical protein